MLPPELQQKGWLKESQSPWDCLVGQPAKLAQVSLAMAGKVTSSVTTTRPCCYQRPAIKNCLLPPTFRIVIELFLSMDPVLDKYTVQVLRMVVVVIVAFKMSILTFLSGYKYYEQIEVQATHTSMSNVCLLYAVRKRTVKWLRSFQIISSLKNFYLIVIMYIIISQLFG